MSQMQRMFEPHEGTVNYTLAADVARHAVAAAGDDPSPHSGQAGAVADAQRLPEMWLDKVTDVPAAATAALAWSRADWVEQTMPTWQVMVEPVAQHVVASMADAMPAVNELTWGQMADKVIMTPGVMYGELMELGTKLAGKGGTIVVTAVAPMSQTESSINLFELAMWNKEIKGTIFGSLNPRNDIPRLLGLYREGQLKLDELITNRYPLTGINDGYEAMRQGENIRGIIVYD
jgi:hypothetical protein